MKKERRWIFALGAGLLAGFCAGCRTAGAFDAHRRGQLAGSVISRWTGPSRLAAEEAIDRYGPPDAISQGGLGWKRTGPWKRIVVWNADADYVLKTGGADDLQQTVAYRVPENRRRALAAFGRGVRVSQDGAELSARRSEEEFNFLALNLAIEIARGDRSPDQAGRFYDRTLELEASGKSSPYLEKLLYPTPSGD